VHSCAKAEIPPVLCLQTINVLQFVAQGAGLVQGNSGEA